MTTKPCLEEAGGLVGKLSSFALFWMVHERRAGNRLGLAGRGRRNDGGGAATEGGA